MCKGLLMSLMLTVSAFANADFISFEFEGNGVVTNVDGSEMFVQKVNYEWMLNTKQLPIFPFPFAFLFETELTTTMGGDVVPYK
jgi:hypothetical protein